jgi:hypothetical protein
MLNKNNERELAYVVLIDSVSPIKGYDRVELAHVGGWTVVVGKGEFKAGDPAIYFEIDSQLPEVEPFTNMEFLAKKHYKIKTQKMCKSISQGLLMSAANFGWYISNESIDKKTPVIVDKEANEHSIEGESRFLTTQLGVTYAVPEDNTRKAASADKYKRMAQRHGKLFSHQPFKWLMKRNWGKKLLFVFFGRKKDIKTNFPTHFPFVKKTDQERCENMTWILNDKTPFIVTQKCDGSSGTYILEKRKNFFGIKYEFYVCSRNVRQLTPEQKSFYDENYYWECAIKYNIKNKLKDYLEKHPYLDYVCWQGEVCSPKIQNNPHGLTETHLFCFHMIDSKVGKYDIRDAVKIWKEYNMETVPIVNENYIFPDDFEEFKSTADGYYDPSVCEGKKNQEREGFVYYKTTDPNFSFKNVSRNYLLKH